MRLKSPLSTIMMFGLTCFSAGFVLLSTTLPQKQTSDRLLGFLVIGIAIFAAVVHGRRILRAIEASKADQATKQS